MDALNLVAETARVRGALQFVDPTDRETWLRMGMALKSEFGDAGYEDWVAWSRQAESFKGPDARSVWASIRRSGGVTIRTLFYEAEANGWRDEGDRQQPSPEDLTERRIRAKSQAAEEELWAVIERANAAAKATEILKASQYAQSDHPYLLRKQVHPAASLREIGAAMAVSILGYSPKSDDERLEGRLLVVPVTQDGSVSTLELIDEHGRKSALRGRGTKAGGFWVTAPLPAEPPVILIGEGVATVLTAATATTHPAVAALSSQNLLAVAQAIRSRYPAAALVILADLEKKTGEPNSHAIAAAQAVQAKLAIPDFGPVRAPDQTDFNDLALVRGSDSVTSAIEDAQMVSDPLSAETQVLTDAYPRQRDWPEPQSLVAHTSAAPYPVDALPKTIRAAVDEVAGFVQAPLAMVANSALGALSLATQGHADVQRAERLQGPVGLYLITVAESGERKSTCDGFFMAPIREFETEQRSAAKAGRDVFNASEKAWAAKYGGIQEKITQLAREGSPTAEFDTALRELESQRPKSPLVPRLIYGDVTPESLIANLARVWPSAGVVSSEAGVVFGSHGMGGESVMRNLATLNQLWDGASVNLDRRTVDSIALRSARLTVALQVQAQTLRSFFDKSGALARGIGFFARFLLAWPESTQGSRFFTDPPECWPNLLVFQERIKMLLSQPLPIDDDGGVTPALMILSPEAKAAWVDYHDTIECGLAAGGRFHAVRDVASKSADNVVRLATLFQVFEQGFGRVVEKPYVEAAGRIAAWHLNEAIRLFAELAMPAEAPDALRLDAWLIRRCREEAEVCVGKNVTRQFGPLRNGPRLDAALRVLTDLARVRVETQNNRTTILVNPTLLNANIESSRA